MEKEMLKTNYKNAVHDYSKKFCNSYGYVYEPNEWVADDVGGVLMVGDWYVNFNTIKYCVDNDVPKEEFTDWYEYCMDVADISPRITLPSIEAWHRGFVRLTDEQIKTLKDAKKCLEDAEENLKEMINSISKGGMK